MTAMVGVVLDLPKCSLCDGGLRITEVDMPDIRCQCVECDAKWKFSGCYPKSIEWGDPVDSDTVTVEGLKIASEPLF